MFETLDECMSITDVIDFYENNHNDESLELDAIYRVADIMAEKDESLKNTLNYRKLMIDASDYCDKLMDEINEALANLNIISPEEWDKMTTIISFNREADKNMSDAMEEIEDVGQLFHEFKGYLHDIGELAETLYGSYFIAGFSDMINESPVNVFWDAEMNVAKILRANGEIQNLLSHINDIDDQFLDNLNDIEMDIEATVNTIWLTK